MPMSDSASPARAEARDAAPRGERVGVLAERSVGRDLEGARLDLLGERLLLRVVGLARELVAQLLDLLVARPAEGRLVARGVDEGGRHRIEHVGRAPRGAWLGHRNRGAR